MLRTALLDIISGLPQGDPTRRKLLATLKEGGLGNSLLAMKGDVEFLYDPFTGFAQVGMGGEWWTGDIKKGTGKYVFTHRKERVDPAYKPVTIHVRKTGHSLMFDVMGGFGNGATFMMSLA